MNPAHGYPNLLPCHPGRSGAQTNYNPAKQCRAVESGMTTPPTPKITFLETQAGLDPDTLPITLVACFSADHPTLIGAPNAN